MNKNVSSIEQKKKDFGDFKVAVQRLLIGKCLTEKNKVPAYIVEDMIEGVKKSGKEDSVMEYSIKSGNKEGKCILIGMGNNMLMLKSNGECYDFTTISRENCLLDMPEGNIELKDIYLASEEYTLSQFFKDTNKAAVPGVLPISFSQALRPLVVCRDGFELSIQASNGHYCEPCINDRVDYTRMEIGSISEEVPELNAYVEMGSEDDELRKRIYAFVPRDVVEDILRKHGGIDKEKTLTESYLTKIKRVEDGLKSANREMQDMKNIASILGKVLGGNDNFWR